MAMSELIIAESRMAPKSKDLSEYSCIFCDQPATEFLGYPRSLFCHPGEPEYNIVFYCSNPNCVANATVTLNAQENPGAMWFFSTRLFCSEYHNRSAAPEPFKNCIAFISTFGRGKCLSPRILEGGLKEEDEILMDSRPFYSKKELFFTVLDMFDLPRPTEHLSRSWPHCLDCLTPKKYMTYGPYCEYCYTE